MVSHDCVAFFLLSREVSKSVRVVQSGQGADEIFAGYDWYPPLAEGARAIRRRQAYAEVFVDRPHAGVGELLAPGRRLAGDPSRAFVAEHFGGARAPKRRSTRRCASTARSCSSTTPSSGSTT